VSVLESGSADADASVGDDDESSGEVVERVLREEATEKIERVVWSLIGDAEEHDAGMRAGRVGADVTEADVERDEHPGVRAARLHHDCVLGACEAFRGNSVDVVAVLGEQRHGGGGDVLIELDLHEPAGRP